jgi:hypothetical protein
VTAPDARLERFRQNVGHTAVRPAGSAVQIHAGDLLTRPGRKRQVVAKAARPFVQPETRDDGEGDIRRRHGLFAGRPHFETNIPIT